MKPRTRPSFIDILIFVILVTCLTSPSQSSGITSFDGNLIINTPDGDLVISDGQRRIHITTAVAGWNATLSSLIECLNGSCANISLCRPPAGTSSAFKPQQPPKLSVATSFSYRKDLVITSDLSILIHERDSVLNLTDILVEIDDFFFCLDEYEHLQRKHNFGYICNNK